MNADYETRRKRIVDAIERIKAWMKAHDARVLVDNLSKGATSEALDAHEKTIGYALPPDVRALWSIHAGQYSDQDGFVGAMDLLGPEQSVGEDDHIQASLEFLRENPSDWAEAGVTNEEMTSNAWFAIAGRGYADLLVVSAMSGRVFTCEKDSPPLHFVAGSVLEWIEAYADRVEAGEYAVEEGFGECYLARDDAMF